MSNSSWVMASFRIVLGLVVAAIGALSLDEVVFEHDINTQMAENKRLYALDQVEQLKQELNEKIRIKSLDVSKLDSIRALAWNDYFLEINGTGGTGIPNLGPVSKKKLEYAEIREKEFNQGKSEMENFKSSIQAELTFKKQTAEMEYNENSLLLRIKALFDLIAKDGWMRLVYIIFTTLIVLLESLVIIVKLFSKETNYELKNRAIEEIGKKRINEMLNNNAHVYDRVVLNDRIKYAETSLRRPFYGIYN